MPGEHTLCIKKLFVFILSCGKVLSASTATRPSPTVYAPSLRFSLTHTATHTLSPTVHSAFPQFCFSSICLLVFSLTVTRTHECSVSPALLSELRTTVNKDFRPDRVVCLSGNWRIYLVECYFVINQSTWVDVERPS